MSTVDAPRTGANPDETLSPHPAPWSREHAEYVALLGANYLPPESFVWDLCAGKGVRFHDVIGPHCQWSTFGTEIQSRWAGWRPYRGPLDGDGWPVTVDDARQHGGTITADSTRLPDRFHGVFDGVCTSLVYDNRVNDAYYGAGDYDPPERACPECGGSGDVWTPESRTPGECLPCRGTGRFKPAPRLKEHKLPGGSTVVRPNRQNYAAVHGDLLHPRNAGLYRGAKWRMLTEQIVRASFDALRPGGVAILDIKNAVDAQDGFDFVLGLCVDPGPPDLFTAPGPAAPPPRPRTRVLAVHAPGAAGYRNGKNRHLRVDHTQVIVVQRV